MHRPYQDRLVSAGQQQRAIMDRSSYTPCIIRQTFSATETDLLGRQGHMEYACYFRSCCTPRQTLEWTASCCFATNLGRTKWKLGFQRLRPQRQAGAESIILSRPIEESRRIKQSFKACKSTFILGAERSSQLQAFTLRGIGIAGLYRLTKPISQLLPSG